MTKLVAALALAPIALAASPALADDVAVAHTDQLVVVTPNPPVVVPGGAPAGPGASIPAAAAAPATAAPQNEDWNNVSHINGQLVKVGERGDYLLRHRKTNISTNPIGWMLGFYGLSISHAVSSNVAIRGDANIMSFDDEDGYELGLSLPIYFRRVYSGPFIEPGIITRGSTSSNNCYDDLYGGCDESRTTMVGPEVLFGWHWTFDSGLNVAAAVGAARDLSDDDDEYDAEVEPAGYFRIGYAF